MKQRWFVLLAAICAMGLMVDAAHAHSRRARTKNPRSLGSGLCTAENRNSTQVRSGYCQKIYELLTKEGSCTKDLLDDIIAQSHNRQENISGMGRFCSQYNVVRRDRTARVQFWQNLLAALITEESHWRPRATGDGGHSQGLMMISVRSANQRAYRCACAGVNARNIRDPNVNLRCGTYIALYNLRRDMAIGHGSGERGSRGLARFFGPMRDGQSHKRSRIASKTNAFCVAAARTLQQDDGRIQLAQLDERRRTPANSAR